MSFKKTINYYRQGNPEIKILGVTATPDRYDEEALAQVFDTVAYEYGINDAIQDGWLVPVMVSPTKVLGLDLSRIHKIAKDFNQGELDEEMSRDKNLHGVASATYEIAAGRKTLLFATTVKHAEKICEILNRWEPNSARFIYAKTPERERDKLYADYRSGKFQFLCNVGIATEGFDEPSIQVVSVARPTMSRALYCQMIGRGTRPLTGIVDGLDNPTLRRTAIAQSDKPFVEIIDFVGNSGKHKLVGTADVLGGNYSDEVVERAKRDMARSGKRESVDSALAKAQAKLREERRRAEQRRRAPIKARARYQKQAIDPFDVLDLDPWREKAWHRGRVPTEKQAAFLEKNGVKTEKLSFTHANQLITEIIQRRKSDKCSFPQAKVLARFGYDPKDIGFAEASKLIDAIAANGWKRPKQETLKPIPF